MFKTKIRIRHAGLKAPLAAATVAMAACGGGTDPQADNAAGAGSQRLSAMALPSSTKLLPTASTPVTKTETEIYTDTFESGPFTWEKNQWGPGPTDADFETNPVNVHTGSRSARFRIDAPALAAFVHNDSWVFQINQRYKFSAWVKTDAPADVELLLRGSASPFTGYAVRTVKADSTWQHVEFEGIPAESGTRFFLYAPTGVTVYLDDIAVTKVTQDELKPVITTAVKDSLFGIHVNKLGATNWTRMWPKLGQKVIRLHNTGTHWMDLRPNADEGYNWQRLDMYVGLVKGDTQNGWPANDPTAEILMELGYTPTWASKDETKPGGVYSTPGSSMPPKDMALWRDYVIAVGTRYKGKIRYWEIWNEWDIGGSYDGTVQEMVAMTRIAYEELHRIDPQNRIVAPSVTSSHGPEFLERFLRNGGAPYVDIVSFHQSSPNLAEGSELAPEAVTTEALNIRAVMAAHGLDHLELWDTEGDYDCDAVLGRPSCIPPGTAATKAADLTPKDLGWPLRQMLLLWSKGVSNFNFHFWEGTRPYTALVYGAYEPGTPALCGSGWVTDFPYNPDCPTPLGKSYARAVSWLKGAKLVDAYTIPGNNGRIAIYKLKQYDSALGADRLRVVLWTQGSSEVVRLPLMVNSAEWSKLKYVNAVDGTKTALPSDWVGTSKYRYVTVSNAPVVLTEN